MKLLGYANVEPIIKAWEDLPNKKFNILKIVQRMALKLEEEF